MERELLLEVYDTLKEVKEYLGKPIDPLDPKFLNSFVITLMKVESAILRTEAELAKLPIAEHYPLKRDDLKMDMEARGGKDSVEQQIDNYFLGEDR